VSEASEATFVIETGGENGSTATGGERGSTVTGGGDRGLSGSSKCPGDDPMSSDEPRVVVGLTDRLRLGVIVGYVNCMFSSSRALGPAGRRCLRFDDEEASFRLAFNSLDPRVSSSTGGPLG